LVRPDPQYLLFDEFPPFHQRLTHHVAPAQNQEIEHEMVKRSPAGTVILECVEGRPAFGIECDDLTVDHRFVG
jgi:hypothetical protein